MIILEKTAAFLFLSMPTSDMAPVKSVRENCGKPLLRITIHHKQRLGHKFLFHHMGKFICHQFRKFICQHMGQLLCHHMGKFLCHHMGKFLCHHLENSYFIIWDNYYVNVRKIQFFKVRRNICKKITTWDTKGQITSLQP